MANPDDLPDVRAQACRRLLTAIHNEPVLLAGKKRLCTALVRSLPDVYPKNGAEGVYAFGLRSSRIGVAIKVADGQDRGYMPAVVETLLRLGAFPSGSGVPEALQRFLRVPVLNTLKRQVGEVTCALPASFGLPATS